MAGTGFLFVQVDGRYSFRDLGMRKGLNPRQEFERLTTRTWDESFGRIFGDSRLEARSRFDSAQDKFLDGIQPRSVDGIPIEHVKAHLEFIHRSFGDRDGWKSKRDVQAEVEMQLGWLREAEGAYSPRSINSTMLHGLDIVMQFLGCNGAPPAANLAFLQDMLDAGIMKDPLFLAMMLDRQVDGIESFSRKLAEQHGAETGRSISIPQYSDLGFQSPAHEEAVAANFENVERPLDLGAKFAFYAVDGQPADRLRMHPDDLTAATTKSLASILTYGIVPGALVGGEINFHKIFLGVDRVDMDLLMIYPDLQATVVVPMERLHGSRFPCTSNRNVKSWHNGNKAHGKGVTMEPFDGLLPIIEPFRLAMLIPMKLHDRLCDAIGSLATRLGLDHETEISWRLKRIIPYNPEYWGNVHNFVEFLQIDEYGKTMLENVLEQKHT